MSGTAKKVWMGVRMLRSAAVVDTDNNVEILDVLKVSEPSGPITNNELIPIQNA